MADYKADFEAVQFESTLTDILTVIVQDDPVAILDLNIESEKSYRTIGDTYCTVQGVNSWDWGPQLASKTDTKYDLVTVFGSLPLDETKHEFLCACDKVTKDHGRVVMNFDHGTFGEVFESVGDFIKYVYACHFVIESYTEFWGRGTSRFVLKKDFGQGHCANVRQYISE